MRRRLMLAMVGLVAVVLVIAGAGSLILTRNAARNQAESQLVTQVNSITSSKIASQSLKVLNVVRATLAQVGNAAVVEIDRQGNVIGPLPEGLTAEDFDLTAVQGGQTVSGRSGSIVYAMAPVTLSASERVHLQAQLRARLRARGVARPTVTFQGTFAVLLTRDVGGLGPSWGYFIVAGARHW